MKKQTYTPHKVTLACYLIKVRELHQTETFLPLDNFFKGNDFIGFIEDFFNSLKAIDRSEERQKTIQLNKEKYTLNVTKRTLSGEILSGEYGIEGRIVDNVTGKLKHLKTKDEAEERPFYFLLHFPKGKDEGILILQRTGILGVLDIVSFKIREAFKKKFPELVIEFSPLVTKELLKTFTENGGIRSVTLTKYVHPSDVATKRAKKDHKEKNIMMQLTFKSPRGGFFDKKQIRKFVDDPNSKVFSVNGIKQLGFDSDYTASMQVFHNGKTRTIDLSDTLNISPYYDIHDELDFESSGHPTFDTINGTANSLLVDLLNDIYPLK